jgi:hypothetical protein
MIVKIPTFSKKFWTKIWIQILPLFILIPITMSSQSSRTYIQLSSVYFIKEGSSQISLNGKLILFDQGRYFSLVNTSCKIYLQCYCSEREFRKYGESIMLQRGKNISKILVQDCYIDSSRIVIQPMNNFSKTNATALGNQRVDIEID